MCRSKIKSMQGSTDERELTNAKQMLCQLGQNTPAPILTHLKVNGIDLEMELDTGATLSVISKQSYHKLFSTGKAPTLRNVMTQLTWESI